MKKKETNKKNTELKVLAAAAVVTAVTMAGSTFAWITSKDEVTNRLAANNVYRTAIYETDFTPTDNWTVDQEITKNVSIVNTGNIDAIVKVSLGGTASMTYWGAATDSDTAPSNSSNADYRKLNDAEITAIEAGGRLVTSTANSYSKYTTENPYEFKVDSTSSTKTFSEQGYYIFQRSDDGSTSNTPTYSGYYCDGSNYYALNTKVTSADTNTVISLELDGVSVDEYSKQIKNYKLMKKQTANTLEHTYDTTNNKVTVKLKKNASDTNALATFEIALDNVGTEDDKWTYIENKGFYYNNDLEAPTENSTSKTNELVKSVTFKEATVYFDSLTYDLNISHESVQVFTDADGKEWIPGANNSTQQVETLNAYATATYDTTGDTNEIKSITWSNAAASSAT